MLRRQRVEALVGMSNAKPLQKAPRAPESAIAGLQLKASNLAQIVRERAQKRSIWIGDDTGHRRHEAAGRHSLRMLKRSHRSNPRIPPAEAALRRLQDIALVGPR